MDDHFEVRDYENEELLTGPEDNVFEIDVTEEKW